MIIGCKVVPGLYSSLKNFNKAWNYLVVATNAQTNKRLGVAQQTSIPVVVILIGWQFYLISASVTESDIINVDLINDLPYAVF